MLHVRACDRKQTELAERKELCARIREKYGLHRAHLVFLANLASLAKLAILAHRVSTDNLFYLSKCRSLQVTCQVAGTG